MTVYCVFEKIDMNIFQSQYVLRKIFYNIENASNFILDQTNPKDWSFEKYWIE